MKNLRYKDYFKIYLKRLKNKQKYFKFLFYKNVSNEFLKSILKEWIYKLS